MCSRASKYCRKWQFLQYNFFPWNEESSIFFEFFLPIFNRLSELTLELSSGHHEPLHYNIYKKSPQECYDHEHFFRVSYQVFPASVGFLDKHSDPVGSHQACAPIVSSMKCSNSFKSSGLSIQAPKSSKEMINYQSKLNYGDALFFDSGLPHEMTLNQNEPPADIHHFLLSVHAYKSTCKQLKSTVSN